MSYFNYVIIVDDNGDLKTIQATEFDAFLNKRRDGGDCKFADDINACLDERDLAKVVRVRDDR